MTSKIRIKVGPVEVEYEGSEEFLKNEIPVLLSTVSKLYKEAGPAPPQGWPPALDNGDFNNANPVLESTTNIAAKLKVDSGGDLVLCAALRIARGLGKASFTRAELHEEIKSAAGYYKQTYSDNLTAYLTNLIKGGKLMKAASNTYSLSPATLQELETRIAS